MTAERVLVTGGAGYIGAVLVPMLLAGGYRVRVLDLYLYGREALSSVRENPWLEETQGDVRDADLVREVVRDCASVIHLACISNDPSFELDPKLGRAINYDAFAPLVHASREAGVQRFLYASSSSVYGVSNLSDVTEEHPLRPLTDYSRYKAMCEPILLEQTSAAFETIVVRPATVCGYSPRQRLDLTVNILTSDAFHTGRIRVHGGAQKRPNIHIQDLCRFYTEMLRLPAARVSGGVFNAGHENHTVAALADLVRDRVAAVVPSRHVDVAREPTEDARSYHISSARLRERLGLVASRTIGDAVDDLVRAFAAGLVPNAMHDDRYHNVRQLKRAGLA